MTQTLILESQPQARHGRQASPRATTSSKAGSTSKRLDRRTDGVLPFANETLEKDFIAYCQLVSAVPCPDHELEAKRAELLQAIHGFRHLDDFDLPEATASILGDTLLEPMESGLEVEQWQDAQGMFAALCATRILTADEERSVMRRMHYLKFLAQQLLSRESIDQWAIARCEGLLRAAHWHRDLMVQANVRLVVSIVKKLPILHEQQDEMISEGIMALMRAVSRFDPRRGFRFSTYATTVIKRHCYQCIHAMRLEYKNFAEMPASVADQSDEDGLERAHWISWRKKLVTLIGHLSRREQVIIRCRYCLGPHRHVKTLNRLAIALKISKERVRQLELGALVKLRALAEAS